MKKFFALLLALALFVLPLTACDNGSSSENGTTTTPPGGSDNVPEKPSTVPDKTITGVTFTDKTVTYNGREHEITVTGTLPVGVSVVYTNNKATEAGTYPAKAVLSGKGYETLTLTATLTVQSIADFAVKTLNSVLIRPNAWQFMPSGLREENMAYNTLPPNDFTQNVSVANIGKKTIGKQMNVLYSTLENTETILAGFDTVFSAGQAIASAYQTFINKNPDSYKEFTGTAAGFSFKIALQESAVTLLAGNTAVSAEFYADGSSTTGGRIQLSDGAALKYQSSDNSLKLALKITVSGVSYLRQLEFVRDPALNSTAGYMYEYMGAGSAALKTTAVLHIDENYTSVVSNKRELDDLKTLGYEEVYNSKTGEMIGGEALEKLTDKLEGTFDTLWFPLRKVTNFNSVRVIHEMNGRNLDTVYLNGSANVFEKTTVLKTLTRKFDVEMKDIWYVIKETKENGKISYKREKCSVPMLFVQTKYFDEFTDDAVSKNKDIFSSSNKPVIDAAAKAQSVTRFEAMYNLFGTIKEQVSDQAIVSYIGEKNSFFS